DVRNNTRAYCYLNLYQYFFPPPLRVPLPQDLRAIISPAVPLYHFVDREFLSVHPLEVHPALRDRVVAPPYRDHAGVGPQMRDHNLRDVPSLRGNPFYESSYVR